MIGLINIEHVAKPLIKDYALLPRVNSRGAHEGGAPFAKIIDCFGKDGNQRSTLILALFSKCIDLASKVVCITLMNFILLYGY